MSDEDVRNTEEMLRQRLEQDHALLEALDAINVKKQKLKRWGWAVVEVLAVAAPELLPEVIDYARRRMKDGRRNP